MSKKVIKYIKCSCGEVNFIPEQNKQLKCYYCGKWEEKPQTEEENKNIVREMVKTLLPTGTPPVEFPDSNICDGDVCPGWYSPLADIIYIPRKTLYLTHDEIADTTAHESAHKLTFREKEGHGSQFVEQYNYNREQLFSHYANWINTPNSNVQFSKGYKNFEVYKSYWEAEYGIRESDYIFELYKD